MTDIENYQDNSRYHTIIVYLFLWFGYKCIIDLWLLYKAFGELSSKLFSIQESNVLQCFSLVYVSFMFYNVLFKKEFYY